MAKTKKTVARRPDVVDKAPEAHTLADIFAQAGDGVGLARAVVKALGLARNDYEKRLIVLALTDYADERDPPAPRPEV